MQVRKGGLGKDNDNYSTSLNDTFSCFNDF